jgi:hypothetical protein
VPNALTTGPITMGQPNPHRPDRRWVGCRQAFSHRPRVACSADAHHRRAGDGRALARSVFSTLHPYGLGQRGLGRTPDRRFRAVGAAAISKTGATGGPARGCRAGVCWPEVLQEADASGGAIGGTISPKEISAAVTFAPRRRCLLTEIVPLGLQPPIGQERSSGGNQDGHDVCVGP